MEKLIKYLLVSYLVMHLCFLFSLSGSLYVYNSGYPFLNVSVLKIIFTVLPYLSGLIISFILLNIAFYRYLYFLLLLFTYFYHLKSLIEQKCSICSAAGFLPGYSYKTQLIIYTIILLTLLGDLYYYFKHKKVENSNVYQ